MSFIAEVWDYLKARRKFWLLPILIVMVMLGGADRAGAGLGGRAVHLHAVLRQRRSCASSASPRSTTTAPRRCVRDGEIVAAAQEERFTRKKHDARFPRHAARATACAEAGVAPRRASTTSRSTTSRSSSSSACSRPTSRSRRAASSSFRMAMPIWLREKLFLKDLLARRAEAASTRLRLATSGCCSASIT